MIFYGKDGDLTGPDREDAETSMLALHLLQSALVHVNTLLVQTVLEAPAFHDRMGTDERRGRGVDVLERALARTFVILNRVIPVDLRFCW